MARPKRRPRYVVECLQCGLVDVDLDEQEAASLGMDHAHEDWSVQEGEKPQADAARREYHTVRARPMTDADWADTDARHAKSLGVSAEVIRRWRHDAEREDGMEPAS